VALAVTPTAFAGTTGGAGVGGGTGPAKSTATARSAPSATASSGNGAVTASADGVTVSSRASGFLRGNVTFTGTVSGARSGDIIEIERLGHQTEWGWAPTAHATVGPGGTWNVVWRANHIGQFEFRAVLESGVGSPAKATSPAITVTVYRYALATQEGGAAVNGHKTACGQTFGPSTIGTANRTLPCGEEVALYYHGRTLVVPVIDRGPYAHGADFDVSTAAAKKLGLDGISRIGAVSLPPGRTSVTDSRRR
jgi:rare lipoprotein A